MEEKERLKNKISGTELKCQFIPFCANAKVGWHHETIEKQRLN